MPDTPWIPPRKLVPPAPPAGWVPRAVAAAPITALVAGPGWGKTGALLALARAAEADGRGVVWFTADAGDEDLEAAFAGLVAAVQRWVPNFAADLAGPARARWARLFDALAAYGAPVFVAIDDAHMLADEVLKGLGAALDRLPPTVRLGLATRRRPPFGLAKLVARGEAQVLGAAELAFKTEEQAALWAALGVPDPGPRAAALEGWPQGLALLAHLPEGVGPVAADYLAEEVVAALPDDLQGFARRLALLEAPSADAWRVVFGPEPDAAQALARLEAEQVVAAGSARLPAFLRDHLLAELAAGTTAAERGLWHRRAARQALEAGLPLAAMPHLLATHDAAEVARVGAPVFADLAARGRLALVARWLDALPGAAAEPVLAYWRAWVLSHAGRNEEAASLLEAARPGLDGADELAATVKLASIALFAQDQARFGKLAMRALALAAQGRPEDVADLHLVRALAAEQRGDMALMRECNEAVLAIPVGERIAVATCRAIAQLNLHTAAFHAGDLAAAEAHLLHAREGAASWDLPALGRQAEMLLANLRLHQGDLDAAGAYLRGLPDRWEDLLDWHDRGCAWTFVGHYHTAKGEWPEAERALAKARAVFERAGFQEGLKLPLERELWLAVRRGTPARALALAAGLDFGQARSIYDLQLALPVVRARLARGEKAEAAALLDLVGPELAALGAGLLAARAALYRAWAQGTAVPDLEAGGWGFLRAEDPELWAALGGTATGAKPGAATGAKPGAATGAKMGTATGAAADGGAPGPPDAAPAGGPPALTLHGFGDMEILQGGIRLDAWPRRKAKLALAALMLAPRGRTAIELAELLADGEPSQAALTTVQVNVSALRRILEPDLAKGQASRYVVMQGERYMLDPALVAGCDVPAFDAAIARARRLQDQDPAGAAAAYAEAGALYRGPLLADAFFQRWFEAERERARADALEAQLYLADHALAQGDEAAGEAALAAASAIMPHDEALARRLMAHHADRRRAERVRCAYWDFRKALKASLGLAPDPDFERDFQAALARAGV